MCLNFEWLGFAPTPKDAIKIIQDTGIFYLSISAAYLISFLYMAWNAPVSKKIKRIHFFSIAMWAFIGTCLVLEPVRFSTFFNGFMALFSIAVLYQLHYVSPYLAQCTLTDPKTKITENKKIMYAKTYLKHYSPADFLNVPLINEQILWLLILYRATITLRASFGV